MTVNPPSSPPSNPARVTFTRDFHELMRGNLRPGAPLLVRYDPARIIPPGDPYVFGDPRAPIQVHAAFRDGGSAVSAVLTSPVGVLPHPAVDATGRGSMLTATLDCPPDADDVRLWFSYVGPTGETFYDSDHGKNFRFGFTGREFRVLAATVTRHDGDGTLFTARVETRADVERVTARVRVVGFAVFGARNVDLTRDATAVSTPSWISWSTPRLGVPAGYAVQAKFYYWRHDVAYKDDNNGRYYLAYEAPPPPAAPGPSAELAQAAQAWAPPGARQSR
jgi:Family of unknown function (DUF6209)